MAIKKKSESLCHIISTEEAYYFNSNYRVMKVTVEISEDVVEEVKCIEGCEDDHYDLTARMNMRDLTNWDSIPSLLSLSLSLSFFLSVVLSHVVLSPSIVYLITHLSCCLWR